MGGTIQPQSAGQPPLAFCSFSRCFMKEEVAAWWSTMVTLASWGEGWREGTDLDSAYRLHHYHLNPTVPGVTPNLTYTVYSPTTVSPLIAACMVMLKAASNSGICAPHLPSQYLKP